MNIKQLCNQYQIEYDPNHPNRSLSKLQKQYLTAKVGNNQYEVIRPLTLDEKADLTQLTDCPKLLRSIICNQLAQSPTNSIRTDTKGFLEMFYLINSKYKYFAYDEINEEKNKILQSTTLPKNVLEDFYSDVYPLLNDMLKATFRRLENELLIKKTDIMMYGIITRTDNGRLCTTKYQATNDQIEVYLSIARNIMKNKYHISKWEDCNYFQRKAINKDTCKEMGWSFVYNDYELILNRQGLKNEVQLQDMNKEVCKKIRNSKRGNLKDYDKNLLSDCIDFLIKIS